MTAEFAQPITRDSVVVREADLLRAELDGQIVLMSVDSGEYYGLDPVASEIWDLLSEPRTVAGLCRDLEKRYRVEPERCERDVLAFLGDLLADGSLRLVDDRGVLEPDAESE